MTDPIGAGMVVRLLASLGLVVGALLLARRYLARSGRLTGGHGLRVIARAALTRSSAVAVVEVDGRRFLVGASEQGVRLVATLEDAPAATGPADAGQAAEAVSTAAGTFGRSGVLTSRSAPSGGQGVLARLREMTVRRPGAARRPSTRQLAVLAVLAVVGVLAVSSTAAAQPAPPAPAPPAGFEVPGPDDGQGLDRPATVTPVPDVPSAPEVSVGLDSAEGALSRTVSIVLLLALGSVAPGLLLLTTTFTRFVIVLGLAKNALGLPSMPPAQVLIGLALFLTFFTMEPVFAEVNAQAVQPLLAGQIGQADALAAGFAPLREFMLAQTREEDLRLFMDLSGSAPADPSEVSAATLIPAFATSELRTGFLIGFVIYVPFLVVDLVVSAVLMSLGMVMLPPVFISTPLKLLLFVLVDGWVLVIGSLVNSVVGVGS